MAWIWLVLAGVFEMVGVAMISEFHKKRSVWSMIGLCAGFTSSFVFLSLAMEMLPMGTAYAVWTGIGASGGAIIGIILYKESADARRLFFIALILASAIGLKLVS